MIPILIAIVEWAGLIAVGTVWSWWPLLAMLALHPVLAGAWYMYSGEPDWKEFFQFVGMNAIPGYNTWIEVYLAMMD